MTKENSQLKRAFTLAEVLIVIGVIGVVAAITIPTLINTISEKAKKSEYKAINNDVFIQYCELDNDLWAKAMKTCKEQGWHLPTKAELNLKI